MTQSQSKRWRARPRRPGALAAVFLLVAFAAGCLQLPGSSPARAAEPAPEVTVFLVPPGSDLSTLDPDRWARGLLSAGMGAVPAAQTMLDISQGARVTSAAYRFRLPDYETMPLLWFMEIAARRAETAPREIVPGTLRLALDRAGVRVELDRNRLARIAFSRPGNLRLRSGPAGPRRPRLRVREAWPTELARLRDGLNPGETMIALELPGAGRLLDLAVAGAGFTGQLRSASTHLVPLVSSVDLAPTVLTGLELPVPEVIEGAPLAGSRPAGFGSIRQVQGRLARVRHQRRDLLTWGSALIAVFFLGAGLAGRSAGIRFAVRQTAVGLPLALVLLLALPQLRPPPSVELIATFMLASAAAFVLRRQLGDLGAYVAACGLVLATAALDLVLGLHLIPYSVVGSNPIGGVRFFGVGNELEAILTVCMLLGLAAWATARPGTSPRRMALLCLAGGAALALVLVPGRLGADVGAVVTISAGVGIACLGLLRRSWKLVAAVIALPLLMIAAFAVIDTLTGASSHFSRTILDAGSPGEVVDVLETRLGISARTVTAESYRPFLALIALLIVVLSLLSRRSASGPLPPAVRIGLWASAAALAVGAIGNDSGVLLVLAGAPFVLSFWALALTLPKKGGPSSPVAAGPPDGEPAARGLRPGRPR